eukprot:717517-Pleurochrysis_carterae.AAC.1
MVHEVQDPLIHHRNVRVPPTSLPYRRPALVAANCAGCGLPKPPTLPSECASGSSPHACAICFARHLYVSVDHAETPLSSVTNGVLLCWPGVRSDAGTLSCLETHAAPSASSYTQRVSVSDGHCASAAVALAPSCPSPPKCTPCFLPPAPSTGLTPTSSRRWGQTRAPAVCQSRRRAAADCAPTAPPIRPPHAAPACRNRPPPATQSAPRERAADLALTCRPVLYAHPLRFQGQARPRAEPGTTSSHASLERKTRIHDAYPPIVPARSVSPLDCLAVGPGAARLRRVHKRLAPRRPQEHPPTTREPSPGGGRCPLSSHALRTPLTARSHASSAPSSARL